MLWERLNTWWEKEMANVWDLSRFDVTHLHHFHTKHGQSGGRCMIQLCLPQLLFLHISLLSGYSFHLSWCYSSLFSFIYIHDDGNQVLLNGWRSCESKNGRSPHFMIKERDAKWVTVNCKTRAGQCALKCAVSDPQSIQAFPSCVENKKVLCSLE